MSGGQKQVWERHHYGTAARWVKEVALLSLAALVVQKILSGASLTDPLVVVGIGTAVILYATAVHLLLKS